MTTDRSELTSRVIPQMVLNERPAPPPPLPQDSAPAARAAARFALQGTAIVTGGAGDLGLATCRALLEHGLQNLVIFDLHGPEQADAAMQGLQADFPQANIVILRVDVTNAEMVNSAVAAAVQMYTSIDILICLAGIVSTVHAAELPPETFRKVLDVNTTGSFLCAQAVAKFMIRSGKGGSIILVASISAHRVNFPQPQVHYNVAKAGVLAMKSSLAAEWARYGIRVNSISPGYMNTILNEGDGLEECRKIWASRNPMGRMGEPDELTGIIVLLASRAGSYITGADFIVDGGQSVF
ncbi:putative short chain dehydrogenase reductase [Diplogelasinospora grovesii]|uniref:D-arabinitol 2-dehydrogenase [ribulose-forming] n=1 Tax=Diplogelasinospora grovesii TaxID=303347 RepID=A0AAN6S402_9PEZI|nr:putative short chain dehydrogenase reductase [Diplogelasinospora grovesii]